VSLSRKQLDAFERKTLNGGMKDLRFTIAFQDGRRTPLFRGNELRMLETFYNIGTVEAVLCTEGENDSGYYTVGIDAMDCECGDGLKCDKVKVIKYD